MGSLFNPNAKLDCLEGMWRCLSWKHSQQDVSEVTSYPSSTLLVFLHLGNHVDMGKDLTRVFRGIW